MLPGARDSYIDLGRFYDSGRLEKRRAELTELSRRYKNAYVLAYDHLAAAGKLNIQNTRHASDAAIMNAVQNCEALLPSSAPNRGGSRSCFLDAFSRSGMLSLTEKYSEWKIYTIIASPADGSAVLSALGRRLSDNACGVIYCRSPLEPAHTMHLMLPHLRIMFSLSHFTGSSCAAALSTYPQDSKATANHDSLLSSVAELLSLAKRNHDDLEEVYNPCVDFSGIYSEAQKHIDLLL